MQTVVPDGDSRCIRIFNDTGGGYHHLKFIRYACAYFWWNSSIMNGGIPQMKRKNEQSTRDLMGTKELSDYSIRTYRKDELVYFLIQPSNLSVLSEESLSARIYGLMTVLKGITEIEMMCLNSRENLRTTKDI